jgi:hypothetical protein
MATTLIVVASIDLPIAQQIGLDQLSSFLSDPTQLPNQDTPIDATGFSITVPIFVSAVAVFVFYYIRFGVWPAGGDERLKFRATRFYTTGVRYALFATLYAGGMSIFFLFSSQFPDYFAALVGVLGAGGKVEPGPELLAYSLAFFLVVWPNIPVIDDSIRRILQENAGIPFEADSLVTNLASQSRDMFSPDPDTVEQVLGWEKVTAVLAPEHFEATMSGDQLEPMLARMGYLIAKLREIAGEKRYSRALKPQEVELHNIESGFDSIIELLKSAPGESGAPLRQRLLKDARSYLRKSYDLVVCSVLTVEGSPSAREAAFKQFGFTIARDPLPIDLNIVIKLLAFAFLGVVVPTILIFIFLASTKNLQAGVGEQSQTMVEQYIPKSYIEAIWWSGFGAAMHILAAIIGVFVVRSVVLEHKMASHNRESDQVRDTDVDTGNVVYYTAAGVIGFSLNVLLLGMLDTIEPESIVRDSWMWAIVPGVTAWFVAYNMSRLIRSYRTININRRSMVHGIGTCVFALIVGFLSVLGNNLFYPSPRGLIFTMFAGFAALLVGFIVSKSVLEWYKSSLTAYDSTTGSTDSI